MENKIKNLINKLKTNYNCNCSFRLDYYENENYYASLLSGLNNKIVGEGLTVLEAFNNLEIKINQFITQKQNLDKYESFFNKNYILEEEIKEMVCCFHKVSLYQYTNLLRKKIRDNYLSNKDKVEMFSLREKILWNENKEK